MPFMNTAFMALIPADAVHAEVLRLLARGCETVFASLFHQ